MQFVLVLLILLGHVFLWIGLVNRLHATGIPVRLKHFLTLAGLLVILLTPAGGIWWWLLGGKEYVGHINQEIVFQPVRLAIVVYAGVCLLATAITFGRLIYYRSLRRAPGLLRFHRRRRIAIAPAASALAAEEHCHHFSVHLPGNEILDLDLTERAFDVQRLPKVLDGLTIAHLSDFHFTGLVGKAYFREVVQSSNELMPDLVAITGDFIDKAECVDWIPDILGKLNSRYGVYAILGNHDIYVEESRLRQILLESGMINVGGRWISVNIRGEPVIIAGNELPWFKPAADLSACPQRPADGHQLRIGLSHSPDQLDWARTSDIDLMLSGHTHGGQICLPIVGPIFSPAAAGVKYASGLFHAPPTIFHVTRGVSGKQPLRWNCPPELALLTLHAPNEKSS